MLFRALGVFDLGQQFIAFGGITGAAMAADVRFMQDMIHHHAQALIMAGWAMTHGASEDVKTLAGRIDVGQHDEIRFMQRWLSDRRESMSANHEMQDMPGMSMPAASASSGESSSKSDPAPSASKEGESQGMPGMNMPASSSSAGGRP